MTTDISISLNDLNYSDYISQFKIYPTQSSARAKGFEAHHIVPVSIQWEDYKKKNNSNISKEDFRKIIPDDRCIRITTLQHFIAHYLMAKELGEKYIEIFSIMCNHNFNKLEFFEKCTLKQLEYFSELREKGYKIMSEKREGRVPWNKGKTGIYTEETIEKFRKSKIGIYEGKENPSFGKHWYNNGIKNIYLDPNKEDIPEGFTLGMFLTEKEKEIHNTAKNRVWLTNGKDNLYVDKKTPIPEGYYKGRIFNPWTKRKGKN